MALYISKIKKIDLRAGGSGNLGASNATMLMGKRAGALTFLHDALKIILAVWIVRLLFPELVYGTIVTSVAGVLGHMYPFYLNFKGGKGFASYIGMCFMINWVFGLIMLLLMLIVALLADWIVAGTFFYILITPIFLLITQDWIAACVVCVASACIFYKHIENIKRKIKGEETGIKEVIFKKK
jgi:glycerol-3-phosphate acyltransferase PlsY